MNSHVISKSRCPRCAEMGKDKRQDNYVNYSDGHSICFSCGYLYNPLVARIQSTRSRLNQGGKPRVWLPSDISIDYPQKALDWIGSYELTIEDLHNHNFLWSESYQRLLYPVWGSEAVLFWTGRYFGHEKDKPKWLNKGSPKDIIHCLNINAKRIAIVEDIISGIKILNAVNDCGVLVLFNSHNPVSKLLKIGKDRHYFLWLDNDKFRESIFFKKDGASYGMSITLVTSLRDPKDESINSIRRILND